MPVIGFPREDRQTETSWILNETPTDNAKSERNKTWRQMLLRVRTEGRIVRRTEEDCEENCG